MEKIAKISCILVGGTAGVLLAKMALDIYDKMSKNQKHGLEEEKYYNQKKMVFEIGNEKESYIAAVNDRNEIEKICNELDNYDSRKEKLDKDFEYGNDCYWKNANKNEFKK